MRAWQDVCATCGIYCQRNLISVAARYARDAGILLSFRAKSNCRHPQCIQSRYTRGIGIAALDHSLFLSLTLSLTLALSLSPRKQIMVIDYPTWKPPSGISITYVCIPTGNLPLIRSNSGVTQFTPASNLKWDYLMAQGTIEMGFPTSRGREVLSRLPRVAKGGPHP